MKKNYLLLSALCLLLTNSFSQNLNKKSNLISNGFELTMNSEDCCQNAKNLKLRTSTFDVGYKIDNPTINGVNFKNVFLIFFENKLWNVDYVITDPIEALKIKKIILEKYDINKAGIDSLKEKNTRSYYWTFNNQRICLSINNIDNRYDLMYYDLDLKSKIYIKQKSNF